jgi:hypothetical protein
MMLFEKGKKLAIIGSGIWLFIIAAGIILNHVLTLLGTSLGTTGSGIETFVSILGQLVSMFLILIGVKYISEKIGKLDIYKNFLLAFILYLVTLAISMVFLLPLFNANQSNLSQLNAFLSIADNLYLVLYIISQAIMMPFAIFKLGYAVNSRVLRIGGFLLFITALLSIAANYILSLLSKLAVTWPTQLVIIAIQLLIILSYVLLLLGFIYIKLPGQTGQELSPEE